MNIQEYAIELATSLANNRTNKHTRQIETFTRALLEEGFTVDERRIYVQQDNVMCRISLTLKVANTIKLYPLNVSYMNVYNSADGDSRVWTVYSDGEYRERPTFTSFDKHLSNAIHSIVSQIVEKEFPEND
jgi:hypothetical protein